MLPADPFRRHLSLNLEPNVPHEQSQALSPAATDMSLRVNFKSTLSLLARQSLGFTITTSLVLSPMAANAQTTFRRADTATLMVQAMNAHSVDEARALLEKAALLLPSESLSPSDEQSLRDQINQTIQTLPNRFVTAGRSGVADAPASPLGATDPRNTAPQADSADTLQRQFRNAPELQNASWRLGELRLMRDSNFVDQIVTSTSNTTPLQNDLKELSNIQEASQPGELLGLLKSRGLIRSNFSADNKDLMDRNPGISLDALARQIIARSALSSTVAAASRALIAKIGGNVTKGGIVQNFGSILGLTIEAAATFVINANLTLQLADLYNIRLNSYEQEVAVLAVFAGARIGVVVGTHTEKFQSALNSISDKFSAARLNSAGNKGFNFLNVLMSSKIVSQGLQAEGVTLPVQPGTTQAPGTPTVPPPSANGTAEPAKAPGFFARSWARVRSLTGAAAPIVFFGAWSNVETRLIGSTAIHFFSRMRLTERRMQNENFRKMMLSPNGDAFLKLMIISVNVGHPMDTTDDFNHPTDPRVQFILNLARSARICSPLDRQQWALAKTGQLNTLSPMTKRVLQYDCDNSLNSSHYVRIKTEFETFNEIPQEMVSSLRLESRDNRLHMGELILQMQFLDGDRSPNEILYFNSVITKYLGFSSADEIAYFNRLHSFIVDNGGMTSAELSPTGFTIGSNLSINPYDLSVGYTSTRSPDAGSIQPVISTDNGANSQNQNGGFKPNIAPNSQNLPNNGVPNGVGTANGGNGANTGSANAPTSGSGGNGSGAPNTNGGGVPNMNVTPNAPQHGPIGTGLPFQIPPGTRFFPAQQGPNQNSTDGQPPGHQLNPDQAPNG